VDNYIADLRAKTQVELDLKIFHMRRLGIPQERIALCLGVPQQTISNHLPKMAVLPNPVNTELRQGFTVPQVAEKHACPVGPEDRTGGWTEPLVWSIALEGKDDLDRFKAVNWGLRTWDLWNWNDCLPREIHANDKQSVFHWGDKRFGDDWPGRIPAQMIAHILYYFSDQNALVLDPMAGGGVVAETCLAFNRKCWSFDMDDRPDTRPEIEPCFWDITNLK